MRRNNMGLRGFTLAARAAVSGERVRIEPSGQTFLLAGNRPPEDGPAWRVFRVEEWTDPARTRLGLIAPAGSKGEVSPSPP